MLRPLANDFLPNQQSSSSLPVNMMHTPQQLNSPMAMLTANQPGTSAQMTRRFQVAPTRGPPQPGMPPQQMPFSSPSSNPVPVHGMSPVPPQGAGFQHGHPGQQNAIRRVTSQPNLQQPGGPMPMGPMSSSMSMNTSSGLHARMQHQQPQPGQLQQPQQRPPLHQQHPHQQGGMHNPGMGMGVGGRPGHPPMPNNGRGQMLQSQGPLMNSLSMSPGHNPMMQQPSSFQGNNVPGSMQPPQPSVSPRPGSQPAHMPNGVHNNGHPNRNDMFMFSNPSVQPNPALTNARPGPQHSFNPSIPSDGMDNAMAHGNGAPYVGGPRPNMGYEDNMQQVMNERFDPSLTNPGAQNVPPRPPSSSNPGRTPGPAQHHSPSHHMPSSSPPHSSGPIPRPASQPQPANQAQSSSQSRPPLNHPGQNSIPPRAPPGSNGMPMPLNPPIAAAVGRQMQPGPGPQGLQPPMNIESGMRPNRLVAANPGGNAPSLGDGQGLMRLLTFSALLSDTAPEKLQSSWWKETIDKYFTTTSHMKLTLWKDNQQQEAKIFEINKQIIPQFFLATMQSGVRAMTLALDGARERLQTVGHAMVECPKAVWTCKYANGWIVTLSGPMTVRVVVCTPAQANVPPNTESPPFVLKFEQFVFDAMFHEKYINLESIQKTRVPEPPRTPRQRPTSTPVLGGPPLPPSSVTPQSGRDEPNKRPWEEPRIYCERASWPGEPVNAFGIPQATMRVLELAESVASMSDLIHFSNDNSLGPIAALRQFAINIRESNPAIAAMTGMAGYSNGPMPPGSVPFADPAHSSAGSLFPHPPSSYPMATSIAPSPKPSGSAANSPQKQHKTIPQRPGSAQAAGASVGNAIPQTSSANVTPTTAPASLKRKQAPGDTDTSPTTGNSDQPPAKRGNRKRRPTSTGT